MNLSKDFIERTKELLGNEALALFSALDEPAPVSIRINPAKPAELPGTESVPWSSYGRYLDERPAFTFDPKLHAGCYYVQEASSMFIEQALSEALRRLERDTVRMLDLCAAPGGKSTLAVSVLPEGSLLVANEIIRTRANILSENLIKWGNPDVVVTQSDPSAFSGLTGIFDILLTDVPCSGEGMFRKDPDSINEWSAENVRMCASRQRSILEKCWTALRPGGFLIYSTCTYNTQEDEENISWICNKLGAKLIEIPVQAEWKITGSMCEFPVSAYESNTFPVYRFFPHKTKGEGFFLALLQKDGYAEYPFINNKKNSTKSVKDLKKQQTAIPVNCSKLLKNSEYYSLSLDRHGHIKAFRKEHAAALRLLEENLRVVHAGVTIGEMKGMDLLPDVSLALSTALNISAVQTCELDLVQAVSYLRREALVLPETCPKGWVLMLFEGHPLGWMKNIGTRANNSWPNEWRIRSENPYL